MTRDAGVACLQEELDSGNDGFYKELLT